MSEGKSLVDEPARRRIREDFGATLIVEAAAGTGKTTALVSRIVAALKNGAAELERVIAVTFTELAAGEMKLRLRTELEAARRDPNVTDLELARLNRAISQLEAAKISTIHSLCVDLLRERPVEARVDPLFSVLSDDEGRRLFDQAFDLWFQRALDDPPEGVRRVLRRKKRGRQAQSAREALREAAYGLLDHRDFKAPWRRDEFARDDELERVLAALYEAAQYADKADRNDDFLRMLFAKIARFLDELRRAESVRGRDHDGLEAELFEVAHWKEWKWRGGGAWYSRKAQLPRDFVVSARDRAKAAVDRFVERAGADLAAALHAALSPLEAEYEAKKRRAGKLDFLDLLLFTRDLLRGSRPVRQELSARFSHVFVDEFQDTDPMQAEILLLLASDDASIDDASAVRPIPGKLFVVGDPKQSIYRFRRADVSLYTRVRRQLQACGAEVIDLTTSFRSAPSIQSAVNAAFAPVMNENAEGSQARYVALEPFRDDPIDQPAVIALPVPRPYGDYGKITQWAIDESFPDAVGAFVHWLVEKSGFTVMERNHAQARDERVKVEARHVCLLFKRLQSFGSDVTRPYVRALEARRIPHVMVGGRSFHTREEITTVRTALSAIEWPDDELSLYATLRGAFFALSDDVLLAYRSAVGSLHPLRKVDREKLTPATREVLAALSVIGKLHVGRNHRPIADTVGRLLDATRAHAGIAVWPTGEQALANVLRMTDLARRFESVGATSFRAFVEWLDRHAEEGQTAEAPVVEEGTDGVRIMTVHKAKGLEFPVVVLVDPSAPLPSSPSRHVDHERSLWVERIAGYAPIELVERAADVLRRDHEESLRVAYVAATRARDLLVVPVVGDERREGWLSVLAPVVHPPHDSRGKSTRAPGCPDFGVDSVLERPPNVQRDARDCVAPGEHAPEAGAHRVTWWDPRALVLDQEVDVGVRQQAILEADRGGVSEAGERAHQAWRARRAEAIARGAVETTRVVSVSELVAQAAPSEEPSRLSIERTDGERGGHPRGKRFGTLVHAVLESVAADAHEAGVRALSQAQGRWLGATNEEVDAAVVRVVAALRHPTIRRAFESESCRREAPITLRRPDGSVVEGVVDLAFRERDGWVVVDFKSDSDLERNRAKYEAQLRAYVDAIAAATGEPARAVLLSV